MLKKIKIRSKVRWRVLQSDKNFWTIGLYSPENKSKEEIKFLEKHNCPEAFLLLEGEITLIIKKDKNSRLRKVVLKKDKMVVVDEYHNSYSPKGGKALVIERDKVKTDFIKAFTPFTSPL